MADTEQAILHVFKSNPSREFDTSELAKEIFSKDYAEIAEQLSSQSKERIQYAKRKKFQLHRKLLYYLNKLVDESILRISRIEEKGEKVFALAVEEGDITFEKGYKKIVITKPNLPSNYIEQYEKTKIMKKYEEESWITRLNSMVIECSMFSGLEALYDAIKQCLGSVNDALALNEFEQALSALDSSSEGLQEAEDAIKKFLERLSQDSADMDKTISIMISPSFANAPITRLFIRHYATMNPRKINMVFNLNNKELQKSSSLFEYIVTEFSKQKIKLNIKNIDLSRGPCFKGRAGVYNFDDDDWEIYEKTAKGAVIGIACSQSAIAVNINRFFELYSTDAEFRKAIVSAAKTLLLANTIQRRKSNEYFKAINSLNNTNKAQFYRFSRNYIRFWNYDWHKDIDENSNLLDLLRSTKEVIDNFCYSEEAIFKSCGIPIRFRIAFSSAFRNFDPVFMGEREYKKANVKGSADFYRGEMKQFIVAREKMFGIFDGGDRLRIFRSMDFEPVDIMHEMSLILSSFKIPFFTYDFSGLRGIVRLTNFI